MQLNCSCENANHLKHDRDVSRWGVKGEVTSVESYNVVFHDDAVACCVVETWFVLTSIEKLKKKPTRYGKHLCM